MVVLPAAVLAMMAMVAVLLLPLLAVAALTGGARQATVGRAFPGVRGPAGVVAWMAAVLAVAAGATGPAWLGTA